MALSRVKVWGNEILTAADLNAEFNNIINNASSLVSPLSGSLDWDGYAHTLDAAGVTTAQSTTGSAWSFVPGSKSGTPSTTGAVSNWAANTYTDSATAASGTAASWAGHSFQRPTLAASNATVTTTNAATVYIANSPLAGTNETLTNPWSLWVDDGNVRLDGSVVVQGRIIGVIDRYALAASVSGNALTIALKDTSGNDASASSPIPLKFRSPTLTTATATIGLVTGALSTVVSNGSTLGTANGIAHRLHVGALLTGSTVELCYYHAKTTTGLVTFSETELISTTAEGGAGAADSGGVMYSTTARTSVPWTYLGYLELSQATAGTWASNPTKIHSDGSRKPGSVVNIWHATDGSLATGATAIPSDNTSPQQGSEGVQFMSVAVTPSSTINRLWIEHRGMYGSSTANTRLTLALFQDATADALTATNHVIDSANVASNADLYYEMAAGTTSSTTFKIKAGTTGGATVSFNGEAGNALFNGTVHSHLRVTEIFA